MLNYKEKRLSVGAVMIMLNNVIKLAKNMCKKEKNNFKGMIKEYSNI